MAKNKIMLFACDPGGANVIFPLYAPLVRKGYDVQLYGKETALKIFEKAGCPAKELPASNSGSVLAFLEKDRPDFIITGTSANDKTERYLWQESRKLGIDSFAVLDQWVNYRIRFSKYGLNERRFYDKDKAIEYLPTAILVMDDFAKEEMIDEGIDPSMIIITGQPYLEEIVKRSSGIDKEQLNMIRESIGVAKDAKVITFAPDSVATTCGDTDDPSNNLGYTDVTILEKILTELESICLQIPGNLTFIIRPHKTIQAQIYEDVIKKHNNGYQLVINNEIDEIKSILISDIVLGMYSMYLIEANLLNIPILSVQIGLKTDKNPFILDRRGIVKSILDQTTLREALKSFGSDKFKGGNKLALIKQPAQNIINNMEKYLCQN